MTLLLFKNNHWCIALRVYGDPLDFHLQDVLVAGLAYAAQRRDAHTQ
jgi:hypothetical protein